MMLESEKYNKLSKEGVPFFPPLNKIRSYMIEKIIELSILSGVCSLMAILFFFNITVVIERVYFFLFI